jgi:hypothetical protein
MAHTQFEKDMLTRIHNEIQSRKRTGKTTSQDETDLETIMTGTETERKSLITTYINDVGIPKCDTEIADCDASKASIQNLKANMEAYVA